MERLQKFAEEFVGSTRECIFIRPQDRLIIMRPNKRQHLNQTACELLAGLYAQETVNVAAVVEEVAERYDADPLVVAKDLENLLVSLGRLLQDDLRNAPSVKQTPFGSHEVKYPVLSEIALTYRCQHKCPFCYADAEKRGGKAGEMTTAQVRTCIDRIWHEAHVPTISFTGGEPTLRPDLPELVAHAHGLGMRTNLITNGYLCGEGDLVDRLADAGLDSAQVSVEAPTAADHDRVVGTPGAFERSVRGIEHFHRRGLNVHTNTTICPENRDVTLGMVDFAVDTLGHEYLSMNMVIRTGGAAKLGEEEIGYSGIEEVLGPIIERARERGARLVWYSPIPLCIFNPVLAGLGSNSCAAADGLLSVAPDGQVLPCSSFETGVGNLVTEPFERVWNRRTAKYWRRKEFLPPACEACDLKALCCGACPLYWDDTRGFAELAGHGQEAGAWAQLKWRLKRQLIGKVKGVNH